ncbi:histone-fold-containing protein [Mollisia scopiformis]|uniref:Histone-fold-containing protein n=1 Tax=Mollisia scopiformis TaxID=149040 RepID=A0A194XBS0_MOLSC|nr:histone-fold-containing protein [Mollisia scopiformis]KUJ17611.1 histone-fold-containing protein [Mollisia scopiformis]
MASPPYNHSFASAISPPYPPHAQLPQQPKRRQSDMPSSVPSNKRRKASMLSTTSATSSAHPLRQTSFPPENNARTPAFSRSPSMDTMSIVSGSVAGGKRKKIRKSKGKDNDTASVSGRKAKSTASGDGGAPPSSRKRRASTAEEEEEEDGGEGMTLNVDAASNEDKLKEERRRQILIRAFEKNGQQFTQYEAWRSSKLSDSTVRRIVNQTLSQSVPPNVILAIKSTAKIFAGEIIERARKVQTEWIERTGVSQTGLPSPPAEGSIVPFEKEKRRGPLLPDHLREAHRRHILEGNHGLVGNIGLWQHQAHSGVERFAIKVQGKRFFK